MADFLPRVALVGAGPGHPGLLTLRAVQWLSRADLVIYDRLVPEALLEHVPPAAERLCISELTGPQPERWPQIHERMIHSARQGKCVVRLKGGDPFVFGRGGEEAEALRDAGIEFEIVPGITAGLAAPAYAGIPVTHRRYASAVALITGHENPAKSAHAIDWENLARFPGTLVIYMGMNRLGAIAEALIRNGKAADTPAAVIQWGTTGEQRTVEGSLRSLEHEVRQAGLEAPAVIVVGPVLQLRKKLMWFEQRPLLGKRILITRPRSQASGFATRLTELGAVPYILPGVAIREAPDWGPVDRALEQIATYQWLVFTSTNGVEAFFQRLLQRGRDIRALRDVRIAAIGAATADAVRKYYLEPDLVPDIYRSENLAAALRERVQGQKVLLARADRGREVLRDELAQIAQVDQIAVYSQVDAREDEPAAHCALSLGRIDFVTLTSSNIALSFLGQLDESAREWIRNSRTRLVSISPVTSERIRALGYSVSAEASEYTSEGIIDALVGLVRAD